MNFAIDWTIPMVWAQQSELDSIPWLKWIIVLGVVFFGIFPGIVAYMVWGERKAAARFQDRIGPNRVGPLGLLQPIADAIKLITKEDLVPRSADQWVHLLAPVLILVSAFLVLPVIPFGVGLAAAAVAVDSYGAMVGAMDYESRREGQARYRFLPDCYVMIEHM